MKLHTNLLSLLLLPIIITQPISAESETETSPVENTEVANEEPLTEAAPELKLDFGDYSSQTLTTKAWAALAAKNHDAVAGYTGKCIEMFEKQAIEMQAKLTAPAPAESANEYWALNDVSTCYLVRAQSKEAQGDTSGSLSDYQTIVDKLSYGQCWDVKGWFWKPADAAKVKIKELAFDAGE